jgi:hypothetical protein
MKPHAAIFQYLILVGLYGLAFVFCYHSIPESNSRFIDTLLGALIGALTSSALHTGLAPKDTTTETTIKKTEETKEPS